jgi:hypothetical protein
MNLEIYEVLLKATASQYAFAKIDDSLDTLELLKQEIPVCFLRHDIDFSPKNAVRMAHLEMQHGVSSTYTVLLSGQYYNPFEKRVREKLNEIKNCGHEVGLHFDPTVHNVTDEAIMVDSIKKEASALADILETPISMFSFHNTTDFSMSCRAFEYGGLVNAYSNFFHNDVEYTSDSNGYWRFRTWEELLFEKHKIIQVLTHPIWWQPKNEFPPLETVIKNIIERSDLMLNDYIDLFKDQEVRINQSLLNELIISNNKTNDPDILSLYAKSSDLIECLRSSNFDKLVTRLLKISQELNLK